MTWKRIFMIADEHVEKLTLNFSVGRNLLHVSSFLTLEILVTFWGKITETPYFKREKKGQKKTKNNRETITKKDK